MRVGRPLAAIVIAGALLGRPAGADPVGPHLELTPMVGGTVFDGNVSLDGSSAEDHYYYGGRLGYQLVPLFGIEAAAGFTSTKETGPPGKDVSFFHASANLMWTPWAALHGGPYAFLGAGSTQLKPSGGSGDSKSGLELGGGWRLWLTDALAVRLEARELYHRETISGENLHINHMVFGAGLTLALGAHPRDSDGDGVPDRLDACPLTPRGATVDARGCPKDSDGDGVLDGIDKCPNTPKGCLVDKAGCPHDSDGDGVCDGVDKCADTPKGATVDASGCPSDSDGDGVLDGIDQCPGTPKGCTVDAKGCPIDSDGDGVCDGLDKCPNTPAGLKVDKDGCPIEVIEKETELLDTGMIRLQNVNFETDKARILPESYPVLDIVGQVLKSWPDLKIEIGGHTDSRGSARHNQKLSEARADSVKVYLTTKFPELKPDQYTAKGYGASRPLVPNNNALNMAKNRRVEFVVLNKDVLRKETEQRRLLKQGEGAPADTTQKKP